MWELPTFILGAIALSITIWVLFEARQARIISKEQLQLSTEPDFEFQVTMSNRDPIQVNCRNRGVPINDFEVFADGKRLNRIVESGNIREEYSYNIDLPRVLLQDNVNLLLKVVYCDRLKRRAEKHFILDISDMVIKPKL